MNQRRVCIRDSFHHVAFVSILGMTSELCFICRRPLDEPQEGGAAQGEGVVGRAQGESNSCLYHAAHGTNENVRRASHHLRISSSHDLIIILEMIGRFVIVPPSAYAPIEWDGD